MKKVGKYWFVCFVLLFGGYFQSVRAQSVKEISFLNLQEILASKEAKVNVVNFWATWCKPCVDEIPAFEKLIKEYSFNQVELSLVSMDFVSQLSRVEEFVAKNKLASTVVLLNEPDYDSWINKLEPNWSGSIPATLIINTMTGEKKFFEKSVPFEELRNEINSFLQ